MEQRIYVRKFEILLLVRDCIWISESPQAVESFCVFLGATAAEKSTLMKYAVTGLVELLRAVKACSCRAMILHRPNDYFSLSLENVFGYMYRIVFLIYMKSVTVENLLSTSPVDKTLNMGVKEKESCPWGNSDR